MSAFAEEDRLAAVAAPRSEPGEAASLRLPSDDLERIKRIAPQRGVPYQTLIGAAPHEFVQRALSKAN